MVDSTIEVRRLTAAIYPTKFESLLNKLYTFCWDHATQDDSRLDRLGNWFNDLECAHQNWRVLRHKHLKGAK